VKVGQWPQTAQTDQDGQRRRIIIACACVVGLLALMVLLVGGLGMGDAPGDALATAPRTTPTPTATPPLPAIAPPHVSAEEVYLIDMNSGRPFLAVNADKQVSMASTTKIMTTLVALTYGKLDQPIRIGHDAALMNDGIDSVAGVKEGETFTLQELLYGLMLPSGDDVAVAIADGVAGSQDRFVTLMNLEATILGLHHTHYVNVHGLDTDGHYTTAQDLAQLTLSAMRWQAFRDIVKQSKYSVGATSTHAAYTWYTTNTLLSTHYYDGVIGVKTGHTGNAGYALVFVAQRPQQGTLLGVIIRDPTDTGRFNDAAALLDWGFQIEQKLAA
jgi:D-alanyl-D-alanine carboxypeptidase